MKNQGLRGNWTQLDSEVRNYWQRLTEDDIAGIAGERDQLMVKIKARYEKTYGEIEREVTEFELRDVRSANAARLSLGIMNDF